MTAPSEQRPTFVLVHGSWHRPAHFGPTVDMLKQHGYRAIVPALPSNVEDEDGAEPIKSMQPDVDIIRKTVLEELGSANVVLAAHSYGGMPGSSALEGLDEASRSTAGFRTSVIAIAGISTYFPGVGKNFWDGIADKLPPGAAEGFPITVLKADPIDFLYHDLPLHEAEKWAKLLTPGVSAHAALDTCKYAAYERIPTHYLMNLEDRALPVEAQRMIVQRIRDAGFKVRVEEIVSGHSPFLSTPTRTVDFLRRSAGEEI